MYRSLFSQWIMLTFLLGFHHLQVSAQIPSTDINFHIRVFDKQPSFSEGNGSEIIQIIGKLSIMEFADGDFSYIFAESGGDVAGNTNLSYSTSIVNPQKYANYYWKDDSGKVQREVPLQLTLTHNETEESWTGYVKVRFSLSEGRLVGYEEEYKSWSLDTPIEGLSPNKRYWVDISPPYTP